MEEERDKGKKEEKGAFFKILSKIFLGLHSTATMKGAKKNVSALIIAKDTYSGPFSGYFEETLRKQKKLTKITYINTVLALFFAWELIFFLHLFHKNVSDSLFNDFTLEGLDSIFYLVVRAELPSYSNLMVSFVILCFFLLLSFVLEKINTLTVRTKKMRKILNDTGVLKKDREAELLHFDEIGVFVNSKKITEAEVVGKDELWKTINIDPGEPVKNPRVKSAFFIPTKFELPRTIIYEEDDFS